MAGDILRHIIDNDQYASQYNLGDASLQDIAQELDININIVKSCVQRIDENRDTVEDSDDTTDTTDTTDAKGDTDSTAETEADDQVADVRSESEFRCEEIIEINASADADQYSFSSERLQECLAREVIDKDAVAGKTLADTGGLPLLPIGGLLLAGAGILVGRLVFSSSRDD